MEEFHPLDLLPLWAVYILTVGILILATELGYRLGKVIQRRWPDRSEHSVGAMFAAALALLGFLLAFVTSIALGNFNERRHLVILEANAIGTASLRAGYLDEPYRTESRELLAEYVDLRLEGLAKNRLQAAITRSEEIHDELWIQGEELAQRRPDPTIALYLASLNDLIDLHTERVSSELGFRVPGTILLGLYCVAVLTMLLIGIHNSYLEKFNRVAQIIVILILSIVFLLIVDLDRSHVGLIQIPQDALIDLQEKLRLSS